MNIRRFVLRANSLDELVRLGTMTPQCARFLDAAVVAGLNLVAAGATQSGKTTLLSCLAAAIPPRERVVTCEEAQVRRTRSKPASRPASAHGVERACPRPSFVGGLPTSGVDPTAGQFGLWVSEVAARARAAPAPG